MRLISRKSAAVIDRKADFRAAVRFAQNGRFRSPSGVALGGQSAFVADETGAVFVLSAQGQVTAVLGQPPADRARAK